MMTGSVVATNDQRLQTTQVPHHQLPTSIVDNNNNDNSTRDTADASAKDDDNNRSDNNDDNSDTSAVTTGTTTEATPDLSLLTAAQLLEQYLALQAESQAEIQRQDAEIQRQQAKTRRQQAKILENNQKLQAKSLKLQAESQRLQAENQKLQTEKQNCKQKNKNSKQKVRQKFKNRNEKLNVIVIVRWSRNSADLVDPSLKPYEHQGSAEFSVDDKFVTDEDLDFEFNAREGTTDHELRSFLHYVHLEENPDNKNGPQILSYQNKAQGADYVKGVVVMCMHAIVGILR